MFSKILANVQNVVRNITRAGDGVQHQKGDVAEELDKCEQINELKSDAPILCKFSVPIPFVFYVKSSRNEITHLSVLYLFSSEHRDA